VITDSAHVDERAPIEMYTHIWHFTQECEFAHIGDNSTIRRGPYVDPGVITGPNADCRTTPSHTSLLYWRTGYSSVRTSSSSRMSFCMRSMSVAHENPGTSGTQLARPCAPAHPPLPDRSVLRQSRSIDARLSPSTQSPPSST